MCVVHRKKKYIGNSTFNSCFIVKVYRDGLLIPTKCTIVASYIMILTDFLLYLNSNENNL